ncbi:transmembrane protein 209 [Patella vulgata]|uniref:transmembrane protein 209 n=1 Tax=Patella vulgata TaxID=6465 RepID=UPI0021805A50|nr:transmembrane protein 209 [Patella vulgata]
MTTISPRKSPVIESTWQIRYSTKTARRAVTSTCLSLLVIFIVYLDICNSSFFLIFDSHPILWYLEAGIVIVILIRILQNILELLNYLHITLFGKYVEISNAQRKLLGVKENEKGFYTTPIKPRTDTKQRNLIFSSGSPSKHTSSFTNDSAPYSPTYFAAVTPGSYINSFNSSMSAHSPYSSYSSSTSPNTSYDRMNSLNLSYTASPYETTEPSSLRSRHSYPSSRNSPVSPYERITSIHGLSQFLKEQDEEEYRNLQVSSENLGNSGSSFWSYGSSVMDQSHLLSKYQYQVSTRSPQSATTKHSLTDLTHRSGYEEVWSQFGVTEDELYIWTEKLRKWISLTVMTRLSDEIKEINNALRRIGCEDTQIGEVGVSTLKQLALTKSNFIPGFNSVVPYLDFSSNQEYLTKRILELGKDGCMSEFCWNGGGHYGKVWGEHLPTDSAIVMHALCTYMDSRLPAQPRFPDGKTFTSQYFMKTPDKPNLQKKDNLLLYQSSINPPLYQVIFGGNTYNLPKGRNNMFQALLLFLYHVKTHQEGMLGRVNLGLSGINILWIFEN